MATIFSILINPVTVSVLVLCALCLTGLNVLLSMLIACIIGGGSLLGGKGDMTGALAGTIFISLLQNAFNLFEINTLLKSVVIGGILVLVVIMDGYMHLKKMRALGRL